MIVTLLDEEYPLSREQLKVKVKEDCGGRLFPTTTKFITFEDEDEDEGGRY